MPEDLKEIMDIGFNRRHFLKLMTIAGTGMLAAHLLGTEQLLARPLNPAYVDNVEAGIENAVKVSFKVTGQKKSRSRSANDVIGRTQGKDAINRLKERV